jgi:hypothetical protein
MLLISLLRNKPYTVCESVIVLWDNCDRSGSQSIDDAAWKARRSEFNFRTLRQSWLMLNGSQSTAEFLRLKDLIEFISSLSVCSWSATFALQLWHLMACLLKVSTFAYNFRHPNNGTQKLVVNSPPINGHYKSKMSASLSLLFFIAARSLFLPLSLSTLNCEIKSLLSSFTIRIADSITSLFFYICLIISFCLWFLHQI